ncbi:proSAAS [Rhinophrynus dorsalis]
MMGPCVLLVAVTVCASVRSTLGKPLGGLPHDDLGIPRRFRRSLPVNNPYESDMMSYLPSESLRNEALYPDISKAMLARLSAYPQEELLAQALERMGSSRKLDPARDNLSLQQLVEEGQRRDKEAMYLANLLHLWNQISQGRGGYPEQLQGLRGSLKTEGEFQRPYQDYDETGVAPIRPQATRNQMPQALQSRYRQDGGYEGPAQQPEEISEDGIPMDEEMLRYLVTRVLSAMSEAEMPQRLSPNPTRRLRRSLTEEHMGDSPTNLLRVKRLDDNPDSDYDPSGLLRRKRIDGDLEGQTRPKHYTDHRVTEQLLQYLPE